MRTASSDNRNVGSGESSESGREFWSLFDISVADSGGIDAYLHAITQRSAAIFRASGASIFLREGETEVYRLSSVFGSNGPRQNTIISAGEGIAGKAIQYDTPLLVVDPSDHALLAAGNVRRREHVGSALVIPLTVGSHSHGVLNVTRSESETTFSSKDLDYAKALGAQVALAISNFRLLHELREAHDQLKAVFECVGIPIFLINREGIRNRNFEAEKLLGDLEWSSMQDALGNGLWQPLSAAVEKAFGGQACRLKAVTEDGETTWSIVAAPMPDGAVTLAIEDVSSTVQSLAEINRLKRLAEIGQMTAAIAHEIRNPLTGIRSAAQMIPLAPEQGQELAGMIEDEVSKLSNLCNQFLDFSKPIHPNRDGSQLNKLVAKIVEFHRSEFVEAGIELRMDELGSCNSTYDSVLLTSVVRNLLLNALQATPPGGSVLVTVGPEGFSISDTGHGMDPATVDRLFTPFFTTKAKGTGLGLSTVRKIVDAHDALITAQSQPGLGTTFSITFEREHFKAA